VDASDGKREKPRFEPPPWEQGAFAELARKREAKEATKRWAAQTRAAREAAEPEKASAEEPRETEPAAVRAPRTAELDERRVADMLSGLRSEEPQVLTEVRPAAGVAAGSLGVLGTGIAVMGLWAASGIRGDAIGMSGALMTAALGAMFVGTALWIWIRATRGKGS
jgi:hypothetical protein